MQCSAVNTWEMQRARTKVETETYKKWEHSDQLARQAARGTQTYRARTAQVKHMPPS
jgi:hypothetical protein